MSEGGGRIVRIKAKSNKSEILLLGVDIYARGDEEDVRMFQRVNRVQVSLNGQVTHTRILDTIKPERLRLGWHWEWVLNNPFVVARRSAGKNSHLLVILEPRRELVKIWTGYEAGDGFRAWTWPVLDGVEQEAPEWFEAWKIGEADIPGMGGE